MRPAILVAAYAAYASAQNLDVDAIAEADPIPTPDIPVVYSTSFDYALPSATVIAESVAYDASAAAASVSAEVAADVVDAQSTDSVTKRDTTTSCTALKALAQGDGTYISPAGTKYTVQCGTDFSGYDLAAVSGSSFANCYVQCDGYPGCVSFSFVGGSGSGTCYLKRRGAAASVNAGVDGGALYPMPTLAPNLCVAQPTGIAYKSSPDTPDAFLADPYYSSVANSAAAAPTGYSTSFTNLTASNNALGYLGYSLMNTYDPSVCASRCDKIDGCQSINVYFERDPSVDPNDSSCSNPTSYTQIKCVYWGGPVTASNAVNNGQWRNNFRVVIAGSNGYSNKSIDTPAGYTAPSYLGNAAINAPPTDCAGYNNSLAGYLWTSGPFNDGLCATACSAYSAASLANAAANGGIAQTCQFFNTYVLKADGKDAGQYCALYQQSFSSSSGTSSKTTLNGITYTFGYSYTSTNATSSGGPAIDCQVASASRIIGSSTLQPFCSTFLGFDPATTTITVTTTPSTTTTVTTNSAAVKVTTTITSTVTSLVATSTVIPQKRAADVQTPPALGLFSASIISSACALQATRASSTISSTSTATASVVTLTSTVVGNAPTSTLTVTVTTTVEATAVATPYGCSNPGACSKNTLKSFTCGNNQCACGKTKNGDNVCFTVSKCTKTCDPDTKGNNECDSGEVCVYDVCCNNSSQTSGRGVCQPLATACANPSSAHRLFRRGEMKFGEKVKRQDDAEECNALSCPGTWVDETTGDVIQGQAGQV
ncbi:unnamed protein product [Aureobasidium mustum]|uniref:Apple domain-containing protein n=1 Tax=Aureobasidium mustum TaxID=2773714 RepID=A0A9N8K646_9PEZI|nr:unnamed protein product [Aureobasidium mustum]